MPVRVMAGDRPAITLPGQRGPLMAAQVAGERAAGMEGASRGRIHGTGRISYILGIYKGLQILLPKTADQWVRKPNRAGIFGGRSALERMASGNVADLYVVRQYIDAQCG